MRYYYFNIFSHYVSTNLKIELAFPEESQLELELNDKVAEKECELESKLNDKAPEKECKLELEPTNKVPHSSVYNLIGIVSLLLLISIPLPPVFLHFYQQFVEQSALTSDDTLLKQETKKQATPLKSAQ